MKHGYQVANISFAYKNREIIEGLKKRGEYVASGDFKNLEKAEEDLNDAINKDTDNEFITPI